MMMIAEGGKLANNAASFITLCAVILSALLMLFLKSRGKKKTAPLPPGPRGLPLIGYLPFLSPNLQHDFSELARKYGPIYKLWLGNNLCVVVSSPALIKQVVRDQDKIMANRAVSIAARVISYGGLDIAFAPYGSYWRSIRKLFVRDMLSNNNLQTTSVLRKTEVRKAVRNVGRKIGTPIDIGELVFHTALNVVMTMIWGGTTVGEQDRRRIAADFRDVTSDLMCLLGKPNISDFFPVLSWFDLQGIEKQMKNIWRRIDRLFDLVLDARMKINNQCSRVEGDEGRKDFLQILLELQEHNDSGISITNSHLKAMLVDIVTGGTDTTASTLEWVMAELFANPEAMKRVQKELDDVVGTDGIVKEEAHLSKLKYLDAVVKETLRLHPAVPFLVPRYPSQSCLVGGYTVPKETRVFLNVYAMHRDPQFWDNPLQFDPKRFLNDGNLRCDFEGNNFQFLPFGSGRRICAGVPLAEKMLTYVLASLLHSFDWKLQEGEEIDLSEKFGIVLKKRKPLVAIPSQRLSALEMYS